MSYLAWATIFLLLATLIYYGVFFGLAWYWREKKTSAVIIPAIYTFEFFLIGSLLVALSALIVQYFPLFQGVFQMFTNSFYGR